MKLKHFLPLGIFAGLVIFLAIGLTLDPRKLPSTKIDKPAPDFTLTQLLDESKTLSPTDLKGQVYLLNVWASWCVACRQEHPLLMELAKSGTIPIYGLNYKDVPQPEDPFDHPKRLNAERFLTLLGNPYTASAYDEDGRVAIDYGVYGAPETFLIDKEGIIRHKHIGPLTGDALVNEILPLAKKLEG